MISPIAQPDWFRAPYAQIAPIVQAPGLRIAKYGSSYELHRSHLPLMDDPEARRLLVQQAPIDWEARNQALTDRGVKPRNVQHAAVDFITQRRGTLLGDEMRVGKGHVRGTKILTKTGWRCVEDLVIGEHVIGSNGRPCRVTGLFPRGVLPVYRVSFSDGASIRVDGEHRWSAWDHNDWHRGRKPRTVETQELIGRLCYANGNQRWRIPLTAPIEFPEARLPIDPYVLGVLLGDGSFTSPGVVFTPGDEDVPREVAAALDARTKLVRRPSKDRSTTWALTRAGAASANFALAALRELGLYGLTSEHKFVPSLYLFASFQQRLALFQGLMDTDGEYSSDRLLQFSSSSEALRDAVRFLVESFGGVGRVSVKTAPRYTYKGEARIGLPSYRLTIALPDHIKPFRARAGYRPRKKYKPSRHISSIEPDGEAEVFCISVDASDQLYLTEHCIVTHNTLSAILSHDPASGPLVIVCPAMVRAVWLGWLERVFPGEPIGVLMGRTFKREALDHRIIIVHYEILAWWQSARKIGTLVFDEAHRLTNVKARWSKAAVFLSGRAERVIAATGTPIWNLPKGLWNVLTCLAPGAFGGYDDFARRYCAPEPTAYGTRYAGISNEAELQARLSEVMIRRRWIDVQQDLPPITRNVVLADLSASVMRKLDVIAAKIASDKATTIGHLASYRRELSHFKASMVVEEAKRMLDRGEPVVIWTWHTDLAETIKNLLADRAYLVTGEINTKHRAVAIEAWNQTPAAALVCTMAVAQVGLDFSHAHLAIFAEIDYTPAILAQAEMRTYSPTRPMNITYVVANHMIEQRIVAALMKKLAASNPLGVAAADDTITMLRGAMYGEPEQPDLDRLLADILDEM